MHLLLTRKLHHTMVLQDGYLSAIYVSFAGNLGGCSEGRLELDDRAWMIADHLWLYLVTDVHCLS